MRLSVLPFVLGMGLLAPSYAEAFCGFFVTTDYRYGEAAGAKLFNNATVVVLMREGTRTVLSMQNNYQGPPEGFAMVVPVPVVLQKDNVKTLPRELFDKVDALAAPRLVEYWEQDPCWKRPYSMLDSVDGQGPPPPSPAQLGVTIEAKFTVAEYDIVVLSANDSLGLDKWLRLEKYKIPDGAEPYLRPYVQGGMKFFVAKVDPAKVKFENGSAMLSPLRFHYDSESFNLPVRLGLVNSAGTQDLLIHIIADRQRYEVANYPNVTIPTNLEVARQTAGNFGAFYAALFDRTLEKHKGAVVTEYAWDATKCDPCPGLVGTGLFPSVVGTGLLPSELMSLGADALPSTENTYNAAVVYNGMPDVKPEPGAVFRGVLYRDLSNQIKGCYRTALQANRTLEATFDLSFAVDPAGSVSGVSVKGGQLDPKLSACVTNSVTEVKWPTRPLSSDPIAVTAPVKLYRVSSFAGNGYVLTRLHARYTKDALGQDLVFRAAPPIGGGTDAWDGNGNIDFGKLEHGWKTAPLNSFQARYVARHPWTGKVTCKSPVRGVWGPPPGYLQRAAVKPATKIAFAPRRGVSLASFLKGPLPEIGLALPGGIDAPPGPSSSGPDPQAKPTPEPVVTAAPEPAVTAAPKPPVTAAPKPVVTAAPKPPPPAPQASGCAACAIMGSDADDRLTSGAAASISAAVLAFFTGLRRARRKGRGNLSI